MRGPLCLDESWRHLSHTVPARRPWRGWGWEGGSWLSLPKGSPKDKAAASNQNSQRSKESQTSVCLHVPEPHTTWRENNQSPSWICTAALACKPRGGVLEDTCGQDAQEPSSPREALGVIREGDYEWRKPASASIIIWGANMCLRAVFALEKQENGCFPPRSALPALSTSHHTQRESALTACLQYRSGSKQDLRSVFWRAKVRVLDVKSTNIHKYYNPEFCL